MNDVTVCNAHNYWFINIPKIITIILSMSSSYMTFVIIILLRPGTLNIFQGRRSLHSVTECKGSKNRWKLFLTDQPQSALLSQFQLDPPHFRLLGVLHYSGTEGVRNSPRVQKLFWGKEDHGPAYMVTPTVWHNKITLKFICFLL